MNEVIWMEGSIELPEGMNEDKFQELWLQFLTDHDLSFNGISEMMKEDENNGEEE